MLVEYVEKKSLDNRTETYFDDPIPVKGVLLKGKKSIYDWHENENISEKIVRNDCSIYPAVYRNKKCWIIEKRRILTRDHDPSGILEEIVSFKKGVNILLNFGVFEWMFDKGKIYVDRLCDRI